MDVLDATTVPVVTDGGSDEAADADGTQVDASSDAGPVLPNQIGAGCKSLDRPNNPPACAKPLICAFDGVNSSLRCTVKCGFDSDCTPYVDAGILSGFCSAGMPGDPGTPGYCDFAN